MQILQVNPSVDVKMIKKFCSSPEPPILLTVARGFAGTLAEAAHQGLPIPESRAGMNYWSPIEELGLQSGIDPSYYGDVVVAKTITIQHIGGKWYKYPNKWYQIKTWNEGPTVGQDPYNAGDYANIVPKEEIGFSEILSKGMIEDYEVIYDSLSPLSGKERSDAPHWKGHPAEE